MRHFNRMSWDCCGSNQALLVSCCLHLSFFLSESFNCLKFGLARDLNDLRWKRKARCAEWRHGGGRGAGFFKPDHYLCLLLWGSHNSFETPHLGESSVCLSSFPLFLYEVQWISFNHWPSVSLMETHTLTVPYARLRSNTCTDFQASSFLQILCLLLPRTDLRKSS